MCVDFEGVAPCVFVNLYLNNTSSKYITSFHRLHVPLIPQRPKDYDVSEASLMWGEMVVKHMVM